MEDSIRNMILHHAYPVYPISAIAPVPAKPCPYGVRIAGAEELRNGPAVSDSELELMAKSTKYLDRIDEEYQRLSIQNTPQKSSKAFPLAQDHVLPSTPPKTPPEICNLPVTYRMRPNVMVCPRVPQEQLHGFASLPHTTASTSGLMGLPPRVKDMIWTYFFDEIIPGICLTTTPQEACKFNEKGSCKSLPRQCVSISAVIEFLNSLAASKEFYHDATSVFFAQFLPRMVTEVRNLDEYDMLEKHVLHGCPWHFIRFTWEFREYPDPGFAVHNLEFRGIIRQILDSDVESYACFQKASFHQIMTQYEAMSMRRPPVYNLDMLTVDGSIGDIYWWIHAYCDAIVWNRKSWNKTAPVMVDFLNRMDYWAKSRGVVSTGQVKFGTLMSVDSTCETEEERRDTTVHSKRTARGWRFQLAL